MKKQDIYIGLNPIWKVKKSKVAQLCLTLYNPMDSSLPASSVQGIFQARVPEWVAISFSMGSSQPRDWTQVSRLAGRCFTFCATREAFNPIYVYKNQSWVFIGGTDAEAPILWPPDVKNWLIGTDPDAGKDLRQKEKGMTEDEMVGWHHQLNGHEFE